MSYLYHAIRAHSWYRCTGVTVSSSHTYGLFKHTTRIVHVVLSRVPNHAPLPGCLLLPNNNALVIWARRDDIAELGMRPANLPYGPSVPAHAIRLISHCVNRTIGPFKALFGYEQNGASDPCLANTRHRQLHQKLKGELNASSAETTYPGRVAISWYWPSTTSKMRTVLSDEAVASLFP